MRHLLRHLFTPHHTNNQRAKLLHHTTLIGLALFLIAGSLTFSLVHKALPSVLGISVNISSQDLLLFTNQQRLQNHLGPLVLDSQLSQAAAGKASDMFANNYWAHVSPSGKTPWDFIRGAGYTYIYAGENLARGYNTASDAVNAWMASPDHRANILSPNYNDVGFAVAQGSLTGDSNTVLIVQMFGSKTFTHNPVIQQAAAQTTEPSPTSAPVVVSPTPLPQVQTQPVVLGEEAFRSLTTIRQAPLVNSIFLAKAISFILFFILIGTLILDALLVGKRKIIRIAGHNIDHIL
ncbi:MAG TPA: CAP domain-containing protein, partial [Patescibacteria group bacterium]|nr:CAP domain-containing protein [Patescibacteria group bacterium]